MFDRNLAFTEVLRLEPQLTDVMRVHMGRYYDRRSSIR